MPMTLYGDARSGNCLKVRWVAERLHIPFQWVEVDVMSGRTREPDFLALNPAGQVPTVVLEDGRSLAQSNAITIYLAEGSDLIPTDAFDRARMLEWIFWEQYSHEPYIAVVRFQVAYLGRSLADVEPRLIDRGHAALARLELQLDKSRYLVGDRLTLADVALVAYTRVAGEGGFSLDDYPQVRRWIADVETELPVTP